MRRLLVSTLAFLSFAGSVSLVAQTTADEANALQADMKWLLLIDSGNYPDAWKTAAKVMKSSAPEPDFAKAMSGARTAMGALATRSLSHVESAKTLPGAPDGHYVVARYSAHFAHKADAVETIVASQEADGSWHVTGYFIR